MALAEEVTRELSPIRSWSNKNYDLKLAEKGRARELQVREATSVTRPLIRPARRAKDTFHSRCPVMSLHNTHAFPLFATGLLSVVRQPKNN